MLGSGLVPLPVAVLDTMWFPSGNMSMSDGTGLHTLGLPVQKFDTAMPNVSFPVTLLLCTELVSAASIRMPVPGGTAQTESFGSTQVFALSLSCTLLLAISLSWFDLPSRFGSVNDRMPPVLSVDSLLWAVENEVFSISNPLTFPLARL